jgi:hypothetical protein
MLKKHLLNGPSSPVKGGFVPLTVVDTALRHTEIHAVRHGTGLGGILRGLDTRIHRQLCPSIKR